MDFEKAREIMQQQSRERWEQLNRTTEKQAEKQAAASKEAAELFTKLHLQENKATEEEMNREIERAKAQAEAEVRARYEKARPTIKRETDTEKALKEMIKKLG